MFTDNEELVRQRLYELQLEHRALDDMIQRMADEIYVDQLKIRRLKKRKLELKDMIARLHSELIPDLDA
ncbi:MAG TPA: DUF465 domain-containing protein [Chromatiales bacterium]|nr:DUF465 domain-containing protein [Thiotrichales bacterium]HIP68810.1 DUF465 domain-containing protein [Chromatiales bacterium]